MNGGRGGLSAGALKALAAALMVADHAGLYLFANAWPLRALGRPAFPIFAFFVAEGARHSRAPVRYLGRMAALAVLSQPAFSRVAGGGWWEWGYLNTLFTLCCGLGAVLACRRTQGLWPAFLLMGAAELLGMDYGAAGVLMVWLFDRLRGAPALERVGVPILAGAVFYCLPAFSLLLLGGRPGLYAFLELLAVGAVPLLLLYNGRRGRGGRWFYAFYPGHLLALWLAGVLLAGR